MERQQATLETIRGKYHHSDTQCRYWQMQKNDYEKQVERTRNRLIMIPVSVIFLVFFLLTIQFDMSTSIGLGLIFIFIITISVGIYIGFFRYRRAVEKQSICQQGNIRWKSINSVYRQLFERAQHGDVINQDEVQKLEQDEIAVSIQVVPISKDDEKMEQAITETQKFFKLSVSPS